MRDRQKDRQSSRSIDVVELELRILRIGVDSMVSMHDAGMAERWESVRSKREVDTSCSRGRRVTSNEQRVSKDRAASGGGLALLTPDAYPDVLGSERDRGARRAARRRLCATGGPFRLHGPSRCVARNGDERAQRGQQGHRGAGREVAVEPARVQLGPHSVEEARPRGADDEVIAKHRTATRRRARVGRSPRVSRAKPRCGP